MERGRWEGQNFQPLKEVQRLEEEEEEQNHVTTITVMLPAKQLLQYTSTRALDSAAHTLCSITLIFPTSHGVLAPAALLDMLVAIIHPVM